MGQSEPGQGSRSLLGQEHKTAQKKGAGMLPFLSDGMPLYPLSVFHASVPLGSHE